MTWKYKTHLCKSRPRGDDFSSKFLGCREQLRMCTMNKQKIYSSYHCSFSFLDLKLSNHDDECDNYEDDDETNPKRSVEQGKSFSISSRQGVI